MPVDKLEGAVEKYLFNIKERRLYILIHLKVDMDNTILPFQQCSFVSLDLFKMIFISFIQRISDQNFPVRRGVLIDINNNEFKSLLKEERFFDCKDPNIIILIVRINVNDDKSIEIYDIVKLINCINIIDCNFICEWKDNFYQNNLDLERGYNIYTMWIKNCLNNLEFNFIKIFLQEDINYIEDIVLELRHPILRQINQKAIRNFNNIDYNVFELADKTDVFVPF
jgi:hypothetical protein